MFKNRIKDLNFELVFEYLFYILFIALIAVSIIKTMKVGTDYRVFYFAGKRILEGNFDLYNISRDGILTYKYSPLFAVLFVPLSLLGYKASLFFWCLINSTLFIIGWISCEKILEKSDIKIKFSHRFLTLLFLLDVVSLNAQQANINAVVFGMVMSGVYLGLYADRERIKYLGLFLIALISSIKLTPMALVVFYFAIREYKKCFILIAMFAALMILPFIYFGFSQYTELLKRWILILSDTAHFPFYKYTNQSPIAQFSRWFSGNTMVVKLISACINTAILLLILYSSRVKNIITTLSLVIILMLTAAPVSWKEYQIILCLPLLFLNIKLINMELRGWALYFYAARILVVNILVQAIIGERLGLLANYHGNFLIGLLLMTGSLVLYKDGKLDNREQAH
ncbi:MAG: glycosyltransferase family 87 protein [Proteobacteria bacterium]|nr:glycosyltransferase family 87 protein [Pseudomonadota bacterium]